jgi:hypothetical protein
VGTFSYIGFFFKKKINEKEDIIIEKYPGFFLFVVLIVTVRFLHVLAG